MTWLENIHDARPDSVFVYGILMADATVRAVLPAWQLDYASHATIVPGPASSVVYGGLVENIDPERLRSYDAIEGVDHGYYSRRAVTVLAGDQQRRAWVYVMGDDIRERSKADGYGLGEWTAERMSCQYDRLGHPREAFEVLEALIRVTA